MSDDASPVQIEEQPRVERDRRMIVEARQCGAGPKLWAYTKLSGPGWLQSAITLGGGSLTGSLYLGVLAGFSLMWLQPLAMILGVIMLSAIGYVALSTGERPFQAINRHVNPVLGWGWALATLMANLVWCMPQFALGTAAVRQNLFPEILGTSPAMSDTAGKMIVVALLFIAATVVVWCYDSGGRGIKIFEGLLKAMVAVVVVSFFGVVLKMSLSSEGLDWGGILGGFVPDLRMLTQPAAGFDEALAAVGAQADFWRELIVSEQRQVMITAAATAVGINMTFLLPYSMLARGWNRDFRGLAIFDLSTGLFIPYLLATSCVVIAAASQFHTVPAAGFLGEMHENGQAVEPAKNLVGSYNGFMNRRLRHELGDEQFSRIEENQKQHADAVKARTAEGPGPLDLARGEMLERLDPAEKRLAAMLVRRDAFNLAGSLERLTGKGVAQYVFGIGVLGMALSTIIILMLINGFVICEMLGLPAKGTAHRLGALVAACVGAAGPFVWGSEQAQFWLAVPTSMFGMVLLPIAYFTFFLMMNSYSLLGENMPRGAKRVQWNLLMGIAAAIATFGSLGSIWISAHRQVGFTLLGAFAGLALVAHVVRLISRRVTP